MPIEAVASAQERQRIENQTKKPVAEGFDSLLAAWMDFKSDNGSENEAAAHQPARQLSTQFAGNLLNIRA